MVRDLPGLQEIGDAGVFAADTTPDEPDCDTHGGDPARGDMPGRKRAVFFRGQECHQDRGDQQPMEQPHGQIPNADRC
ncbi:hypothetical protein G6F32_017529 [Rhizopus arrhizus]|nr:hypothetical protein G6F32_017529 [Rhizopus arrhizus]